MTSGANDIDANLPVAAGLDTNPGAGDAERNVVFGSLVTGDSDIVGLVAYSIYKQNKHDWLVDFAKAKGREPNDAEAQSYIIGESTARRLAIYRHLAKSTLDGNGPEVARSPASESFSQRSYAIAQRNQAAAAGGGVNKIVLGVLGAVVVLAAFWLVMHFGLAGGKS